MAQGGRVQQTDGLTLEQRADYDAIGFVILRGFADEQTCTAMLDRVVEIARAAARTRDLDEPGLVLPEANLAGNAGRTRGARRQDLQAAPRPGVRRVRHRPEGPRPARRPDRPDASTASSRSSSSRTRARGDSRGTRTASTSRSIRRGRSSACGSRSPKPRSRTAASTCCPARTQEPIHEHVPDRRPDAHYGYVEIVDHDMTDAIAVHHGSRRPAALRQPPHAPLDRQRIDERSAPRWCTTTAATGTVARNVDSPVNDFVTVR